MNDWKPDLYRSTRIEYGTRQLSMDTAEGRMTWAQMWIERNTTLLCLPPPKDRGLRSEGTSPIHFLPRNENRDIEFAKMCSQLSRDGNETT